MKHAFDERNIEIPFPHQTIYFGEDKNGNAPEARVKLFEPEKSQQAKTDHGVKMERQGKAKREVAREATRRSENEEYSDEPS